MAGPPESPLEMGFACPDRSRPVGDRTAHRTGQVSGNVAPDRPCKRQRLVEQGWKQEKAADREMFLACFQMGLSDADEALLELALQDRAKGVREKAADLLARMPTSQYQLRMQERASTVLVKKPLKLSVLKKMQGHPEFALDVQLPEEIPADWVKDGIQEKSQTYGLGNKGYWMVEVVSRTQPASGRPILDWTPGGW